VTVRPPAGATETAQGIDRSSPVPLYHQLEQLLRDDIAGGQYAVGSPLPSESAICERYGVSRSVVRQTLTNLAAVGLIRTERGRGSFVAEQKLQERFVQRAAGLFDDLHRMGYSIRTAVLAQERAELPLPVQDFLGEQQGLRIDRVRSVDGRVLAFIRSYLSAERFSGLLDEGLEDRSLYGLIEQRWSLRPTKGSRVVESVGAPEDIAPHLGVEVGEPLLFLRGTSRDQHARPLEWFEAWHRGDRTSFEIEILPSDGRPTSHVLVDHGSGAENQGEVGPSSAKQSTGPAAARPITAADPAEGLQGRIAATRVIAVLRAHRIEAPAELASVLVGHGFSLLAVAATGSQALETLAALATTEAVVGARGVRDAASVGAAIEAGARFLMAPMDARDEVLPAAGATPVMLAGLSPAEVSTAWLATRTPVEVFPFSMGGASYLRTLRDALPGVPVVPAGGVGEAEVPDLLAAGSLGVTIGSALCPPDALARGDLALVAERARSLRRTVDAAGHP
jgi:GntR family transcriptional regulator